MFDSASKISVAFQVRDRSQKTHDFEMLRLMSDFKTVRLAGV